MAAIKVFGVFVSRWLARLAAWTVLARFVTRLLTRSVARLGSGLAARFLVRLVPRLLT